MTGLEFEARLTPGQRRKLDKIAPMPATHPAIREEYARVMVQAQAEMNVARAKEAAAAAANFAVRVEAAKAAAAVREKPKGISKALIEAIFGATASPEAAAAVRAAEEAEEAAKEAADQAEILAARQARVQGDLDRQAKIQAGRDAHAAVQRVAGLVRQAKNAIAADGVPDLYDHKIDVVRGAFEGQPELVRACEILALEPEASGDRAEDVVAECYGMLED